MIFINNSADYSACGLGKAPIVAEETRQLLSGFTGITDKKALAFQDFLEAIGGTDGTIWNSIDRLYIPMFANGILKDAFFEIKEGLISYTDNSAINDENVGNYYRMTEKGITIIPSNVVLPYGYKQDGNLITKKQNNILVFAISEPCSIGSKNLWFGGEVGTNSTASHLKVNTNAGVLQISNNGINDIIALESRNATEAYAYGKVQSSSVKTVTNTTIDEPTNRNMIIGTGTYYPTYSWPVSLKMFGFGNGLSNADASILANAISTFNENIDNTTE